MSEPKGIVWSAPVLIRAEKKGLAVSLPQRVVDALKVTAGDVLNFTQLPDGAVEVWMVKKSGYASLDAMTKAPGKKAAKAAKSSKGKAK
jgi:antitoxin component of MazEF toxin-antitoxin module